MTGLGITQEDIATMLQIDHKTLYKYFRRELDTGAIEANMRVAQSLYTNATKHMNVGAQIWWTKTRMGWKAPQELTVGGNGTPIAYTFRWADPSASWPSSIASSCRQEHRADVDGPQARLTERKPNARVVHILPYGVMWQRTGPVGPARPGGGVHPGRVVRRSELAIRLPNGSVFQCGGADNVDSWRGGGADLAIVDEFDDTPPSLVPLVIEPMLADRNGTLVRSGTPKGRGCCRRPTTGPR
jgi:hypothetical protein